VGPRAGLDTEARGKKLPLPGIEPRSPGSPARSQTLYNNNNNKCNNMDENEAYLDKDIKMDLRPLTDAYKNGNE
jgi:hypothetical protein